MKTRLIAVVIVSVLTCGLGSTVRAQMVTEDEARIVAENWVQYIIGIKGSWGGAESAHVEGVEAFRRGDRVLGFFCRVRPAGDVVVSLRRELTPVKSHSSTCSLDPSLDDGITDYVKIGMERVLDAIEARLGPVEHVSTADLESILEMSFRQTWEDLEGGALRTDYQEGGVLLTSAWAQGSPYNDQCPPPPSDDDCTEPRCSVGCVAVGGAQVMRYWNWPPYGEDSPHNILFDWPNMPDQLDGSSPPAQVGAVAELCHLVGVGCGMDYCDGDGCASGASFSSCWGCADLLDTFEDHYRYSDNADDHDRDDFSASGWFGMIKYDLNRNRPIPYAIPGHVVVVDGWQEIAGDPIVMEYHINYGWGSSGNCGGICNRWYALDGIHGGNPDEEILLEGIYPDKALGSDLIGAYSLNTSFPYRYFDRDALGLGGGAVFQSGQKLQFLPDVVVSGSASGTVRFNGSSGLTTVLFTRGDKTAGVKIHDGAIQVHEGGGIMFD